MNSSIKKNLGLQTAYQILSVCMPLITAPYLARRLGAEQLGIFSFTTSVVMYFTLVAMLGTVNYGTRSIAAVKNDREKRNDVFSSVFALQIVATILAIIAYSLYLAFLCKDNQIIAQLQSIALLSCLVDINWLFFGVEDFQITVTRSIIIRIITVVLILLFVKQKSDLWIYTLIMLGGTFLSNAILFLYLPRYASLSMCSIEKIKEHIRPNLVLFMPLLAMTVYHIMDKTMLGTLSTYEQSGYYYNADKIVQIPLSIINGIGTVMLPRMSALLAEGKRREADKLFITTMEGVSVVSIAIACGIAAVSKEFIPFFFGAGFEECITLTIVFTPILIVKGLSVIIRTQYLIPMEMEKDFTKSVLCGAVVNLILNIVLIPSYGAMGATIATVISELVACAMQFTSIIGRGLKLIVLFEKTSIYLIVGFFMIGVVRLVAFLHLRSIIMIPIEIIAGTCFYGIICLLYWKKTNNLFYEILFKPILNMIKRQCFSR